jgi:hypothetical protein
MFEIKPIKIRIGFIKVTIGADKIREVLASVLVDQVDTAKLAAYLTKKGMPSAQALAGAEYAKEWLRGQVGG